MHKEKRILINTLRASLRAIMLFCSPLLFAQEEDLAEQRIITIVESAHEFDLNPHTASFASEAQFFTGLYEGLFSYDPVTLDPLPAICKNYKISRDKKRWTFTLAEDAVFSDGTPITAETFKDSWLRLLQTPGAPFASLLDCIAGAEEFRSGTGKLEDVKIDARDSLTLVVHLKQSTSHLPRILCHHAFSAVSTQEGVYSGAFILSEYGSTETGNYYLLTKNESYRQAEDVMIPGIKIILSDDSEENAYLFNTGKADWISGSVNANKILNTDAIHISAEFGTTYLFFKAKNAPWNNTEFREALLEAVPYDVLRKDYSIPATTLVYPLAGYSGVNGINDYDADDALELMQSAREKAGIPQDEILTIVFACTNDDYMKEWAETLKAAWAPLGVELVIQTTPSYRYNSSISAWNADIFSYSWIGDFADPLAFLELFRGGSSLNVAGYKNEAFDTLLKEACNANTSVEHMSTLAKAEQLLLDDCMIIPISHPITLHIIDSTELGGWQTNALDLHPLKYLYLRKKVYSFPNLVMAD